MCGRVVVDGLVGGKTKGKKKRAVVRVGSRRRRVVIFEKRFMVVCLDEVVLLDDIA